MSDVTVLIPFHGACPFLAQTLQSLHEEADLRVILINDRADPAALQVARDFCAVSPGREVMSAPEAGLAEALRFGVGNATTEFVARLDADDVAFPDRFQAQAAYLTANPDVDVLGSQIKYINEAGVVVGTSRYMTNARTIARRLRWECPVAHPAVMVRRSAVLAAGSYRTVFTRGNTSLAEDYDLWIRMGRLGAIHNVDEYLTGYRVHPEQLTATNAREVALATILTAANGLLEERGQSIGPLPIPIDEAARRLADKAFAQEILGPLTWRQRRQFRYRLACALYRHGSSKRWPRAFPLRALSTYPEEVLAEYVRHVRGTMTAA